MSGRQCSGFPFLPTTEGIKTSQRRQPNVLMDGPTSGTANVPVNKDAHRLPSMQWLRVIKTKEKKSGLRTQTPSTAFYVQTCLCRRVGNQSPP